MDANMTDRRKCYSDVCNDIWILSNNHEIDKCHRQIRDLLHDKQLPTATRLQSENFAAMTATGWDDFNLHRSNADRRWRRCRKRAVPGGDERVEDDLAWMRGMLDELHSEWVNEERRVLFGLPEGVDPFGPASDESSDASSEVLDEQEEEEEGEEEGRRQTMQT